MPRSNVGPALAEGLAPSSLDLHQQSGALVHDVTVEAASATAFGRGPRGPGRAAEAGPSRVRREIQAGEGGHLGIALGRGQAQGAPDRARDARVSCGRPRGTPYRIQGARGGPVPWRHHCPRPSAQHHYPPRAAPRPAAMRLLLRLPSSCGAARCRGGRRPPVATAVTVCAIIQLTTMCVVPGSGACLRGRGRAG